MAQERKTLSQFKDMIVAYLDKGGDADAFLNRMPRGKLKIFAAGVMTAYQNPDLDLEDLLKFGNKYQDYVLDIIEQEA